MTSTSMICSHNKGGENLTERECDWSTESGKTVVHYVELEVYNMLDEEELPCCVMYRAEFTVDEQGGLDELLNLELAKEEQVTKWIDSMADFFTTSSVRFDMREVDELVEKTGIDVVDAMKIISSMLTDLVLMISESKDK